MAWTYLLLYISLYTIKSCNLSFNMCVFAWCFSSMGIELEREWIDAKIDWKMWRHNFQSFMIESFDYSNYIRLEKKIFIIVMIIDTSCENENDPFTLICIFFIRLHQFNVHPFYYIHCITPHQSHYVG